MKLGSHKNYFKCDFKTILAPLFIVMKKAFVELCNNVSMTLLLGLSFISQAANFVVRSRATMGRRRRARFLYLLGMFLSTLYAPFISTSLDRKLI